MTYDVHALRAQEFPGMDTRGSIFLNSASTGPLPLSAVDAVAQFMRLRMTPEKLTDAHLFGTFTRSRELLAQLIGAKVTEIALATNTGYGINVAAAALPLAPGDVVIVPDAEFPANMYPWLDIVPKRGGVVRTIPTRDGVLDEEALVRALDEPRVKILAVSWVGFVTGYRVDLATIGRLCKARGIYFVVDAIQGLGVVPLDVHACSIDILACGAQKWLLSPWGSGFMYVREGLVPLLQPPIVSWVGVKGSDDFRTLLAYDLTWRDDARRFEFITLPFQDFIGMNASLDLLLHLGPQAIEAHIASLVDEVVLWAQIQPDLRLVTPADRRSRAGIVSIAPANPEAVSARLQQAGIAHSQRERCIRLAIHCFTTREDITRTIEVIESVTG